MVHFTLDIRAVTTYTVKSFNFMGTIFRNLTMMDMFMDTWIHGVQIMCNITKMNKKFGGILNHG